MEWIALGLVALLLLEMAQKRSPVRGGLVQSPPFITGQGSQLAVGAGTLAQAIAKILGQSQQSSRGGGSSGGAPAAGSGGTTSSTRVGANPADPNIVDLTGQISSSGLSLVQQSADVAASQAEASATTPTGAEATAATPTNTVDILGSLSDITGIPANVPALAPDIAAASPSDPTAGLGDITGLGLSSPPTLDSNSIPADAGMTDPSFGLDFGGGGSGGDFLTEEIL